MAGAAEEMATRSRNVISESANVNRNRVRRPFLGAALATLFDTDAFDALLSVVSGLHSHYLAEGLGVASPGVIPIDHLSASKYIFETSGLSQVAAACPRLE